MIPTKKESLEIKSTMDGEVIGMSIDENSLQHIMDVLAGLYSDQVYAIIREYSTNAWDSHIEAGNKSPIQVTLPSYLSPFLKVQDWGIGMDAEDIRNVYSKYGLSTKTDTNEQTGSLGLGSKSAFAYTSQFTVIGVKNGIVTTVNVSRDEEGIGLMTIVDESPTDDPNGVTITIPAKPGDIPHFKTSANRLFYFWPKGTVLVNGEEPQVYDGLKVDDQTTLIATEALKESSLAHTYNGYNHYVIMGNVPYPIDKEKFDFEIGSGSYRVIARIPMGSVHFTPSRDSLNYTKMTMAKLGSLKDEIVAALAKQINEEIDKAPDRPTALRTLLRWRYALPKALAEKTFRYRGTDIPDQIKTEEGEVFLISNGQRETDWNGRNFGVGKHSRASAIDLSVVPEAMWVYGFNQSFTPTVKRKLWHYCDEVLKRDYPAQFITCHHKPNSPWIEPKNIIAWQPVSEIKLPRVSKALGRDLSGRIPGSYDVYVHNDGTFNWEWGIPAEDFDDTIPLYWDTYHRNTVERHGKALAEVEDAFQIVALSSNRIDKFRRFFPQARQFSDVAHEYWKYWSADYLAKHERDLIALNQTVGTSRYLIFGHGRLADPRLNYARTLARMANHQFDRYNDTLKWFKRMSIRYSLGGEWDDPMERYPLLKYSDTRHTKHNRLYVNAVYKELISKEKKHA